MNPNDATHSVAQHCPLRGLSGDQGDDDASCPALPCRCELENLSEDASV